MEATQGVKGLQGFYHVTDGSWVSADKLKTLCGTAISPNFRDIPLESEKISCPRCKVLLQKQ